MAGWPVLIKGLESVVIAIAHLLRLAGMREALQSGAQDEYHRPFYI